MGKLPNTLPSESFRKRFQDQLDLDRFRDAREAWNRLEEVDRDLPFLLAHLEVYCSHVLVKLGKRKRYIGQIQKSLKANSTLVADAEKLAEDLTENANRLERINREPEFLRELTWRREKHDPNLPDNMLSQASWLKSVAERIRSPFSLRDQPGQVIRSAAAYIRSVTGEDRLNDLAALVRAAYAAHEIDKDVDADALGKVVTRAGQRMKERIKRKSD